MLAHPLIWTMVVCSEDQGVSEVAVAESSEHRGSGEDKCAVASAIPQD